MLVKGGPGLKVFEQLICYGHYGQWLCWMPMCYVDLLKTRVSNSGALCSLLVAIDLMQQATNPMWDYVRGRLWKQAAVTHSIEYSGMDGSRHVLHDQRVILLYIF